MNYKNIGNAYINDRSASDIRFYAWIEANQDKFTDIDFQELKEMYLKEEHSHWGDKEWVLGLVDKILKSRLIKLWIEP
jgi:hypothetical protein